MPHFLQRFLIRRKFEALQRLCEVRFDMVWSFDNSVFYDFSALPTEVYCISHIVDLNQDFNTATAAKTANCCFGVIPAIVERLQQYNAQSYLIPHAVQAIPDQPDLMVLPGNNTVKALYTGNMSMPHIDWSLIIDLAIQYTHVDFVFMGSGNPGQEITERLKQLPNFYFHEAVKSDQLIHYLYSADILLLAYTDAYYTQYASPHKMLEYLASGKVIMATWTAEYQQLFDRESILMAKSHQGYLSQFKEVVENLEFWNSDEKRHARKYFAKENTYKKQITKIENLL